MQTQRYKHLSELSSYHKLVEERRESFKRPNPLIQTIDRGIFWICKFLTDDIFEGIVIGSNVEIFVKRDVFMFNAMQQFALNIWLIFASLALNYINLF